MKIYTALQMGDYHTNHCEDYLFVGDVGNNKILGAVMDGCTMAQDSYFASTLVGKLLRKIALEKSYQEFYNPEKKDQNLDVYLKSILQQLFEELLTIKKQLLLEKNELLTTLIILLMDKKNNNGVILAIGDGLVAINGHITTFDQDNRPDYLGFHLGKDFEEWYNAQHQKLSFDDIQDISIATDGIFTFEHTKDTKNITEINILDYLLNDLEYAEKKEMLEIKLKRIEKDFGLKPTDDFGMIRIIKDTTQLKNEI